MDNNTDNKVNNIGKRLKELRAERNLTLDMVVYDMNRKYDIGLSKGNLSRWENGINLPSLMLAAHLSTYYNVSLDYLAGITDTRTPAELLAHKKRAKK